MAEIPKEEDMEYYGSDPEDEDGDVEDEAEVLDSDDEEETKVLRRPPTKKRSSFFLEEFTQESLTKAQVLRRLVFCSLMLNLTFVTWGVIQVCISCYSCEFAHLGILGGNTLNSFTPRCCHRKGC